MDEEEFRRLLNPAQYRVMREKGTEEAYSGKYNAFDEHGLYSCAACGNFLFASIHKFDAKNGWPAFTKPLSKRNVILTLMPGSPTEISCKKCQSHLGYAAESDGRSYLQINSIALDFQELPQIELKDSDDGNKKSSDEKQQSQEPSKMRTVSLAIGGLTVGVALGASGALYTAPQSSCVASQPLSQTPNAAPTANSNVTPPPATAAAALPPPRPTSTSSTGAIQPTAGSPIVPRSASSSAADGTGAI